MPARAGRKSSANYTISMAVSQELLDILVCPSCKQPVKLTTDKNGLRCERCSLVYPIVDDIPVMLADKAVRG